MAYQVSAVFLLLSSLKWGNLATSKEGKKNVAIVTKTTALTQLLYDQPNALPQWKQRINPIAGAIELATAQLLCACSEANHDA